MIRNYLGFPRGVSGRQLKTLACDQTAISGPEFAFDRATRLHRRPFALVTVQPGRHWPGKAECFGVGPAVVLGQRFAESAGRVGHGALADLAAGDRKLGDGDRETAGGWVVPLLL